MSLSLINHRYRPHWLLQERARWNAYSIKVQLLNTDHSTNTQMFYFIFLCNSVEFPQAFERNPEPAVPEMQQSEGPLQMNGGRLGRILLFSSSRVFFNNWLTADLFLKGRGIENDRRQHGRVVRRRTWNPEVARSSSAVTTKLELFLGTP